ncbi:MAG: DUF1592 domain-containing protein [Akkermansiaceae bacterium]|nr:DUF1592 domain-containing protein [Akkermansiaceae bacterium]NNM28211.1 DUF1592 domain-containing protein [Akkermansiaceae bacterium]
MAPAWLGAVPGEAEFEEEIGPLLEHYCYDCHGDGSRKGDVSLDEFGDVAAHLADRDHWLAVWRNIRTQIMPPSDKEQLDEAERRQVLRWIERRVFKLDPDNPDPGRVTIRRMNREEYRNTVEDLLGVRYEVHDHFPPDDTGYGFDTIGDVLSLSPLLLEKYLRAADEIMTQALPSEAARTPEITIRAEQFQEPGNRKQTGRFMEFEIDHTVREERELKHAGRYEIELAYAVEGSMEATENTGTMVMLVDGRELDRAELGWDYRKQITLKKEVRLEKGKHRFEIRMIPGNPPEEGEGLLGLKVAGYKVRGPLDAGAWMYPETYTRILFRGPPPEDAAQRESYAREILRRFAGRAYRRPVDDATLGRLVELAAGVGAEPGKTFEDGIRSALMAVLSSPRFLFRAEVQAEPDNPAQVVPIDEYALASRLSYFLWGSMPDDALLELAGRKALRKQLRAQVDRMLADPKADRFIRNFTGQWLQARDVEGVHMDARRILSLRDSKEANRVFNTRVRRDMRKETELLFGHILRENRPALELITADYSFLNERLARFYKIDDVHGEEFRRVEFGDDWRRGGILTQGTFLVVTSNPTRTSPVKRGLFVLDNILGTPAPPPPGDVPELDEARREAGREATMREAMERHRREPLCKACHARMDPIGLALENFNALGMWRDREGNRRIDSAGQLITGEQFGHIGELKTILATTRRGDFHRCLAEKLMTYALGRGVEYYDTPAIDGIVMRMHAAGGGLREAVQGIVESAPFQLRRGDGRGAAEDVPRGNGKNGGN